MGIRSSQNNGWLERSKPGFSNTEKNFMKTVHFTGRDGLRLIADVDGNAAHPPVIFLHGGGQTRWSWGESARKLVELGYYVICPDARGHGESGWAAIQRYELDDFADDLRVIIATLVHPPVLIGASLGGITALVAVGESTTPLAAALVLVDVAPRIDPEGAERIGKFMSADPDGFASVEAAADAIAAYIPHRPRPRSLGGLQKNLRQRANGRFYWHWDPNFLEAQGASLHPMANYERLAQAARGVSIPTLLVRGGESDIVSEAGARELLELIPHAECSELAGAHHMVAGDSNDSFSSVVFGFLQRVSA